jgi:hypothetical protein
MVLQFRLSLPKCATDSCSMHQTMLWPNFNFRKHATSSRKCWSIINLKVQKSDAVEQLKLKYAIYCFSNGPQRWRNDDWEYENDSDVRGEKLELTANKKRCGDFAAAESDEIGGEKRDGKSLGVLQHAVDHGREVETELRIVLEASRARSMSVWR